MIRRWAPAAERVVFEAGPLSTEISNQIRGLMKTFGLVIPKGKGGVFEANVRDLIVGQQQLPPIILPLLEAW